MTPPQKIKWLILQKVAEGKKETPLPYPCEDVDLRYELAEEEEEFKLQDARDEIRCSGEETGMPSESSRCYESYAVAKQMPDNSWVGWTYWYGGGKYGEPESIGWIDDAYHVDCLEEEKLVIVKTFTHTRKDTE
jgi:hypothetical protein